MSGRLQLLILLALLALWVWLGSAQRREKAPRQTRRASVRVAWVLPGGPAFASRSAASQAADAAAMPAEAPSLLPRQKFGFIANSSIEAGRLSQPIERRDAVLEQRRLNMPEGSSRRQPLKW